MKFWPVAIVTVAFDALLWFCPLWFLFVLFPLGWKIGWVLLFAVYEARELHWLWKLSNGELDFVEGEPNKSFTGRKYPWPVRRPGR